MSGTQEGRVHWPPVIITNEFHSQEKYVLTKVLLLAIFTLNA